MPLSRPSPLSPLAPWPVSGVKGARPGLLDLQRVQRANSEWLPDSCCNSGRLRGYRAHRALQAKVMQDIPLGLRWRPVVYHLPGEFDMDTWAGRIAASLAAWEVVGELFGADRFGRFKLEWNGRRAHVHAVIRPHHELPLGWQGRPKVSPLDDGLTLLDDWERYTQKPGDVGALTPGRRNGAGEGYLRARRDAWITQGRKRLPPLRGWVNAYGPEAEQIRADMRRLRERVIRWRRNAAHRERVKALREQARRTLERRQAARQRLHLTWAIPRPS